MKKSRSGKAGRDSQLLREAEVCHENLIALSELLQGYVEAEWTRPDTVARASKMIAHEAGKLYGLLQTAAKQAAPPQG